MIVGRGQPTLDAKVNLRVQRGDKKQTLQMSLDREVPSDLAPRVYGQVAVGQLEDLMQEIAGELDRMQNLVSEEVYHCRLVADDNTRTKLFLHMV